ncbi:MAG: DUF2794 domain-containing protein [Rhodobacteraceae bacterium]|nr:DUF2794 domain-containing protein [Paracoccaceae bacterium]
MSVHNLAKFRNSKTHSNTTNVQIVSFNRSELNSILQLYGQMVANGIWRDYGISHLSTFAVFSVFRRTAEVPLYQIEKHPSLAGRDALYQVKSMNGKILKRGNNLKQVLKVLDKKRLSLIS